MSAAAEHLQSRLSRLETRVRALRLTVVVGGCLVLAAALPGASSPGPVRATELQLVDSTGKVLAHLGPAPGGARLVLYDDAGRVRLSLHHDTEETALFLNDTAGTIRVGLAQFAHGGGGLALHGPENRGAAVLYYKGGGTLTFYGDTGQRLHQIPTPGPDAGAP